MPKTIDIVVERDTTEYAIKCQFDNQLSDSPSVASVSVFSSSREEAMRAAACIKSYGILDRSIRHMGAPTAAQIEKAKTISTPPTSPMHRNSGKPSQLQAHAYVQGTDIHIAPGQERQLPHESWHVVQQAKGGVKPTVQT